MKKILKKLESTQGLQIIDLSRTKRMFGGYTGTGTTSVDYDASNDYDTSEKHDNSNSNDTSTSYD